MSLSKPLAAVAVTGSSSGVTLPSASSGSHPSSSGSHPSGSGGGSARGRHCKIVDCTATSLHLRRHFIRTHVPWFAAPFTACWNCEVQEGAPCFLTNGHGHDTESHPNGARFDAFNAHLWGFLMNGLFHFFCKEFGLDSVSALLDFVRERRLYPTDPRQLRNLELSPFEQRLMFMYERDHQDDIVSDIALFSVQPPNRIISLSHWQVLASLLNLLSPSARAEFVLCKDARLQNGYFFMPQVDNFAFPPTKILDAHCHLDSM